MPSNPVTVTIPANCVGQIVAMTNAAWTQRATITIPGTQGGTFLGSGEGAPMPLTNGRKSLPINTGSTATTCSIFFEFSSRPGTWNTARVSPPVITTGDKLTTIQIVSEDSADNDNNDTILGISLFSTAASEIQDAQGEEAASANAIQVQASATTPETAQPEKANLNALLDVHAKTYYNNPAVQGGVEHNISLDFDSARPGPAGRRVIPGTCRSMGWESSTVQCEWVPGVVWNTVILTVICTGCTFQGMAGARLVITTSTWCTGTKLANWWSPDWTGEMSGTTFTLREVTP
ncbi:hypothetical protein OHC33_004933 [Knufia fluminis]|uniref:Uncharacterized protein n=1 Tax=Knufia fluminis TaxID=191047 RepID=A0AAN8F951_9EURO|nr:hypothetical protein OHC33_004933 [Knufia fluminis]